jgi:hypothetical protein
MEEGTLFGIGGAVISASLVIFARSAAKDAAKVHRRMGLPDANPNRLVVFYRVFGSVFFALSVYLIFL